MTRAAFVAFNLFVSILLRASPIVKAEFLAYHARLEPIPGVLAATVLGTVAVFTDSTSGDVAYAGSAVGLPPNLGASNCTAVNGCGVHIHSGESCFNTTLQGGHLFQTPITDDPWTQDRYVTDNQGVGKFAGVVNIGTIQVAGKAVVLHSSSGSRLACGILLAAPAANVMTATTNPLGTSSVSGNVVVMSGIGGIDRVCYFGSATGLEKNLSSTYDPVKPGSDCNATNGCGTHIHSGDSCYNTTLQGGHYYDNALLPIDPWAVTGYLTTDASGKGRFVDCLPTGKTEFTGHPFVIHANSGGRVSCGLLSEITAPTSMPSKQPPKHPSAGPTPSAICPASNKCSCGESCTGYWLFRKLRNSCISVCVSPDRLDTYFRAKFTCGDCD